MMGNARGHLDGDHSSGRLGRLARLGLATAMGLAGTSMTWLAPTPATPRAAAAVIPGKVIGWGYNASHQIDIPTAAQSGIVAISAGCNHSVALKYTGQVIAWGDDTFHQTDVPTAARSGVTVISAGCQHTLALTGKGRVVAWGDDSVGQTDVPSLPSGGRWFAIAAGEKFSAGLANKGSSIRIYSWGNGANASETAPWQVKDLEAGDNSLIFRLSNGTVRMGGTYPPSLQAPAGLTGVVGADLGRAHALALKSNGKVVAWGDDGYGQIDVPAGLSGVTAISAGGYHSLALKSNGSIIAWGRNDDGQASVPVLASGQRYSAVSAGGLHSLAIIAANVPTAPTGINAVAGNASARVTWIAPTSNGGAPITGYTVTSDPGALTCKTTGALTCTVTGLANGTTYTFTVTASNAAGTSAPSARSSPVIPIAPATPTPSPTPTPAPTPTATATATTAPTVAPPTPTRAPAVTAAPANPNSGNTGSESTVIVLALLVGLGLAIAVVVALLAFSLYQMRKPVHRPINRPPNPPTSET